MPSPVGKEAAVSPGQVLGTSVKGKRKRHQSTATALLHVAGEREQAASPDRARSPNRARSPGVGSEKVRRVKSKSHQSSAKECSVSTCSQSVSVSRGRVGTGKSLSVQSQRVVELFVTEIIKKGVDGIKGEFQIIVEEEPPIDKFKATGFRENMDRNRYKDVTCLEATRPVLRLNSPPETDYIHANRVDMTDVNKLFIATQVPLKETIPDFWRLCYQESVASIVMLFGLNECSEHECIIYWPTEVGCSETYGCITVTCHEIDAMSDASNVLFDLDMTYDLADPSDPSRTKQIKLTRVDDWPTRSVPSNGRNLINILRNIDKRGPCVVHCLTGIGRTAVAIATESAIQKIVQGKFPVVKNIVQELRCKRAMSVQDEKQYLFIFSTILEYIKFKERSLEDKIMALRRQVRRQARVD